MKKYFNVILIISFLLLLFPFLALPELFENIYVSVLAFIIGYTSLVLREKINLNKLNYKKGASFQKEKNETPFNDFNHNQEDSYKKISDIRLEEGND